MIQIGGVCTTFSQDEGILFIKLSGLGVDLTRIGAIIFEGQN